MKKKLSRYVHLVKLDGYHFAFFLVTREAVMLNPRIYDLILHHRNDVGKLQSVHPELYDSLLNSDFIVDAGADESAMAIERFRQAEADPSSFSIIVNPTLDCNLRCWYCYETHRKGSMMPEQIVDRVKMLIDSKIEDSRLKRLTVSFFGGEPLLGWDRVVMSLLHHAKERCDSKGIAFSTGFTTNGVLLDDDKFEALKALGLTDTSFQITLDGNRALHDNSRVGAAKKPTYDVIVGNIKKAVEHGFFVTLRFNYTPDNVESFIDVLSEFESLSEEARSHINCDFQRVWQVGDDNSAEKALQMAKTLKENGLKASVDILYRRHSCYADHENSIVVNYNGDVFKCTAREFNSDNREGVIDSDGSLVTNDRYKRRMELKYANAECRDCRIMPICNGRCSQSKLESDNVTTCLLGLDEPTREKTIIGSLYEQVFNRQVPLSEISGYTIE